MSRAGAERERMAFSRVSTAKLPTKILYFRGFDSSITLISRGGIPMSTGKFPEIVSQQILVGMILVGRLGVEREHMAFSRVSRLRRRAIVFVTPQGAM